MHTLSYKFIYTNTCIHKVKLTHIYTIYIICNDTKILVCNFCSIYLFFGCSICAILYPSIFEIYTSKHKLKYTFSTNVHDFVKSELRSHCGNICTRAHLHCLMQMILKICPYNIKYTEWCVRACMCVGRTWLRFEFTLRVFFVFLSLLHLFVFIC